MPPQLEKKHVGPPSALDEALAQVGAVVSVVVVGVVVSVVVVGGVVSVVVGVGVGVPVVVVVVGAVVSVVVVDRTEASQASKARGLLQAGF